MRSVQEPRWERQVCRAFGAFGLIIHWDGKYKRFFGLPEVTIARLNPRKESKVWCEMPEYIRNYEKTTPEKPLIMLVTSNMYGDVEDQYVVMRLGTLLPFLETMQESGRWEKYATRNKRGVRSRSGS